MFEWDVDRVFLDVLSFSLIYLISNTFFPIEPFSILMLCHMSLSPHPTKTHG